LKRDAAVFKKESDVATRKRKAPLYHISTKPKHEKLPWPGLKAKDYLSRVVTRAVRDAKERREKEVWAENQIARVLDQVPPEVVIRLVFRVANRRGKPIHALVKASPELLLG
jgi:hypothetical protein